MVAKEKGWNREGLFSKGKLLQPAAPTSTCQSTAVEQRRGHPRLRPTTFAAAVRVRTMSG